MKRFDPTWLTSKCHLWFHTKMITYVFPAFLGQMGSLEARKLPPETFSESVQVPTPIFFATHSLHSFSRSYKRRKSSNGSSTLAQRQKALQDCHSVAMFFIFFANKTVESLVKNTSSKPFVAWISPCPDSCWNKWKSSSRIQCFLTSIMATPHQTKIKQELRSATAMPIGHGFNLLMTVFAYQKNKSLDLADLFQ